MASPKREPSVGEQEPASTKREHPVEEEEPESSKKPKIDDILDSSGPKPERPVEDEEQESNEEPNVDEVPEPLGPEPERPVKDEEPESSVKPEVDDGVPDSSAPEAEQRVALNPADCNLDFDIESNGLQGSALYERGFAYCWSGARATVGIKRGKYCFSCKIISAQSAHMQDTAPDQQHLCRLGISRGDDMVGDLGETQNSFGFGGTSKFSNAGKFSDYGEKFGIGDTIVCAVDLDSKPLASIGFSKNGKWLGIAKQFDAGPKGLGVVDSPTKTPEWESAVFPHVLLKNVVVQVQFSVEEGLLPEEGYKPWASALEDGNAVLGPTFSNPSDCEVMMLVGLPASGKTTWAEKWVKEHPEKRYVLLGTNLILDQMKVPGLLRKNNYGERFGCLVDRATEIFNTLLSRAARVPRNYILDQTNVFKSARKRKMKQFACFRKIAVVVFPSPEELKLRSEKRFKEMGKEVPADAVNQMLVNYSLPVSKDMRHADEYFDQVIFPEHDRVESQRYLDEMKRSLVPASGSDFSPYSRETSVHLRTTPVLQNQLTSSVTVGHWQGTHLHPPPPMNHYQRPYHVNPAYQSAGMHGSVVPMGVYPHYQNSPPSFQSVWRQGFSNIRGPEANLPAPSATGFVPGPSPTTYGSTYGAPAPPYGNYPGDVHYSGNISGDTHYSANFPGRYGPAPHG